MSQRRTLIEPEQSCLNSTSSPSSQWSKQLASRSLAHDLPRHQVRLLCTLSVSLVTDCLSPVRFRSEEVPEQHRMTVLTLYRIWMFLILVLIVNLVAAILLLISGGTLFLVPLSIRDRSVNNFAESTASNGGSDLGAAIMYVPVIGTLSFLLWCTYLTLFSRCETFD